MSQAEMSVVKRWILSAFVPAIAFWMGNWWGAICRTSSEMGSGVDSAPLRRDRELQTLNVQEVRETLARRLEAISSSELKVFDGRMESLACVLKRAGFRPEEAVFLLAYWRSVVMPLFGHGLGLPDVQVSDWERRGEILKADVCAALRESYGSDEAAAAWIFYEISRPRGGNLSAVRIQDFLELSRGERSKFVGISTRLASEWLGEFPNGSLRVVEQFRVLDVRLRDALINLVGEERYYLSGPGDKGLEAARLIGIDRPVLAQYQKLQNEMWHEISEYEVENKSGWEAGRDEVQARWDSRFESLMGRERYLEFKRLMDNSWYRRIREQVAKGELEVDPEECYRRLTHWIGRFKTARTGEEWDAMCLEAVQDLGRLIELEIVKCGPRDFVIDQTIKASRPGGD